MFQDRGVDTGPILLYKSTRIETTDSCGTLHDRLADLGGRLLVQHLDAIVSGELDAVEQDELQAIYAPKISKHDAVMDWRRSAHELRRDHP